MLSSIDILKDEFKDETAYLIGSGSSLDAYPKDFFKFRCLTIGLNEVCLYLPCAFTITVHHEFFPDLLDCHTRFVISRHKHLLKDQGSPAFQYLDDDQREHYYFTHPENGFGTINHPTGDEQLPAAGTCTVPGLAFCRWLGVRTVYLCGIDGRALNGKTNYAGYAGPAVELEGGYIQHLDNTRHLIRELIDSWGGDGPEVIGLNPFLDFYSVPK